MIITEMSEGNRLTFALVDATLKTCRVVPIDTALGCLLIHVALDN